MHAIEPTFAVAVFVDELRATRQRLVDLDHRTSHGRVDIARRLDRLDDGACTTDVERRADLRHIDENEIAEGMLSVIGDADFNAAIRQRAGPFVGFGVAQIGENLAHGGTPQRLMRARP